jgi:predicted membrane protein
MDSTVLIWEMLFGAIGLGFFSYGKKQKAIIPFVTGVSLFIFPYFVSNVTLLVVIGFALIVMPYFVRI